MPDKFMTAKAAIVATAVVVSGCGRFWLWSFLAVVR